MTDTHHEFTPIDDAICERILARGKYIYNCMTECENKVIRTSTGMPVNISGIPVNEHWRKYESALKHVRVSVKCDRCNTKDFESSFNWNGYDLCLPCAGEFRRRSVDENRTTKDMVRRELVDYSVLAEAPSRYRDTLQLIRMNFGMVRYFLPETFWSIPNDTLPTTLSTNQQFNNFIRDTAARFVHKFGEGHLAKCFHVDLSNDPIYGGEEYWKASEKATRSTEEDSRPNPPQTDWGKPNLAWDEAQ